MMQRWSERYPSMPNEIVEIQSTKRNELRPKIALQRGLLTHKSSEFDVGNVNAINPSWGTALPPSETCKSSYYKSSVACGASDDLLK